jgi:hypothetical protein
MNLLNTIMKNGWMHLLVMAAVFIPFRIAAAPLEESLELTLELQKSVYGLEDGARRRVPLDIAQRKENVLAFSCRENPAVRLFFRVESKQGYRVLRLLKVVTPEGEHATRVKLSRKEGGRMFPLDAEVLRDRGGGVVFASLLKRGPDTKLGAVALWEPANEEVDDEILYRVWANEGLPHPAIGAAWTVERAKQWVAEYIEKFRNYSEIYITGETLQELKDCVDYAEKMEMTCVYMHLATWSGRYWPANKSLYDLNEKLFPNGHADFKELVDYAGAKGIGVGLRTLSNGISLENPDYVSVKPDKRLSHFWRGTLVNAIDPDSEELVIKSDKSLPTSYNTKMERGFYDFVHIDDEILKFKSAKENKDGSITLTVAAKRGKLERGYGWTEPAAHRKGAPVKILMGAVGDKCTPDHDSSLLDEIAGEYAGFNNMMQLITSSFDGLMIYHINTEYGKTKFPGAVYSKLDHPTFSTTSGGRAQWGWFEQDFNLVRKSLGLNKPRSIPQRMTLMLGLHQDIWPAPSPYGYTYGIVPNAVAGFMWCSIQNQNGLHDLDLNTFRNFGLLEDYSRSIQRWRKYGPDLPEPVKERIFSAYDGSPKYPLQVEHFRLEENGAGLDVVPFRPMRRKGVDRGWGYIQEHGPVYTYQNIRPNGEGLVQAENPYHAQVPEFIIRVMQDFNREMLTGYLAETDVGEDHAWLNKILDEKALSDGKVRARDDIGPEKTGLVNYSIMIPPVAESSSGKRKVKVDPGQMELGLESDGAWISYDNQSRKAKTFDLDGPQKNGVVSYSSPSSINKARGLGIVITGDGSGALFVVRIRGRGTRDYVIPIDFEGRRYIEIPDPQVSWSDARFPITSAWKRWSGHTVKSVKTGFATVPPSTKAAVFVEDIRLLPEKESALINPVVECGNGTISINGTIPSDRYIWYKGGDKVDVFDLNWNQLEELPATVKKAEVPAGRSNIRIKNNNSGGDPWVECQFFVRDKPIHRIPRHDN